MRLEALVVFSVLATGCEGDDAVETAPPPADADIADTLQCGPTPPGGPGNVAELQRAVIDTALFPDALCNDGTPAVVYFRPYAGEANRGKWMINLSGGGSCHSPGSCAARWCNCATIADCPHAEEVTNFKRTTMTNVGPAQKAGDGLFHRGGVGPQANRPGDYNQVQVEYCSSDLWRGAVRGVTFATVNPVTGEPVTYRIHFLGAKIVDAVLATLRQDGVAALVYTLAGASTALPDLDEATEVIVTGDSAGGAGVIVNLDFVRDTLKQHNAGLLEVSGLLDASVGPDKSRLDFGAYRVPEIRSYDDYLTARSLSPLEPGARHDESCLEEHAADTRPCLEESHVLRHHITTPFFVRMALRDSNISANYIEEGLRDADMTPMTTLSFALTLHDELGAFPELASSAEEGAAIAKAPGVFGPACTKHDTIHDNTETFGTTLTPPNGVPLRLVQVLENWLTGNGTPTHILTESLSLDDTHCP